MTRLVVLVPVVIALIATATYALLHSSVRDYERLLRAAGTHEAVEVGSIQYEVNNGVVLSPTGATVTTESKQDALRLAMAKTMARRSPLMALPGVDTEKLHYYADNLAKTAEKLSSLQVSEVSARRIRESLYPSSFLHAIADSEKARRDFLNNGDVESQTAYEAAISRSLEEYERNLRGFREAFVTEVGAEAQPYAASDVIVTRSGILAGIDALVDSVQTTRTAHERRQRCTSGKVSACDAADLDPPIIGDGQVPGLSAEALETMRYVRDIWAQATGHSELSEGPMYIMNESACVGSDPMPAFEMFSFNDPMRPPGILTVHDTQFIDGPKYREVPFFEYMLNHQIRFIPSVPLSHYKCINVAEDHSRIFLIEHVLSEMGDTEMRETFSYEEALAYLDVMRRRIVEGILEGTDSERLTDLLLEASLKTSGFEYLVGTVAWSEDMNAELEKRNLIVELSAPTLFYLRNGLFPLYLSHNASVVQMESSPFARNNIPRDEQPFVFLSSLTRDSITRHMLVRDVRFYFTTHSDPTTIKTQ